MKNSNIPEISSLSPNYFFTFNFEQTFEYQPKREWMQKNWHQAFYWIALYMILVFGGQAYMSNRPPFFLKKKLAIWNIMLAIFSIAGTSRTLPELFHVIKNFGFLYSICNSSYVEVTRVSGFWTWLFALSKVFELCDTLFIVLRKRNLIFLHWYHHITVLLFTWYSYGYNISVARWYICMNYLVHSAMYSYYAFRALDFQLPKMIPMLITFSQIIQMIVGFYVTLYASTKVSEGLPCKLPNDVAKFGLIMYGSYFVLFAQFFINSYYGPKISKETNYLRSKTKAS